MPQPVEPGPPVSSLDWWLTGIVCIGAGMVYLSLMLQSVLVFGIGELVCLVVMPFILWAEREKMWKWWRKRWE